MGTYGLYSNGVTTDSVSFTGSFTGGDASYGNKRYSQITIKDYYLNREWTFNCPSTNTGGGNSYFSFTITHGDRDKSGSKISFVAGRTYIWQSCLCYVRDGVITPASPELWQVGEFTLDEAPEPELNAYISAITYNSVSFTADFYNGDPDYGGKRYLRIKRPNGTKVADVASENIGGASSYWTVDLNGLSSSTSYTFILVACYVDSGTITETNCQTIISFTTTKSPGYEVYIYGNGWSKYTPYIYNSGSGWQQYTPRIYNSSTGKWEPS